MTLERHGEMTVSAARRPPRPLAARQGDRQSPASRPLTRAEDPADRSASASRSHPHDAKGAPCRPRETRFRPGAGPGQQPASAPPSIADGAAAGG
jgi:hypothetical protein